MKPISFAIELSYLLSNANDDLEDSLEKLVRFILIWVAHEKRDRIKMVSGWNTGTKPELEDLNANSRNSVQHWLLFVIWQMFLDLGQSTSDSLARSNTPNYDEISFSNLLSKLEQIDISDGISALLIGFELWVNALSNADLKDAFKLSVKYGVKYGEWSRPQCFDFLKTLLCLRLQEVIEGEVDFTTRWWVIGRNIDDDIFLWGEP